MTGHLWLSLSGGSIGAVIALWVVGSGTVLETVVTVCGATAHSVLAVIGDQLGLSAALADAGPLTSSELAENTNTAERYVREWLRSQATSGT